MNNDRQKALEFLREKNGWVKKSPIELQARLQKKRIYVSLDGVRECQAIVRAELKTPVIANNYVHREEDLQNVPIWEIPLDDDRLFVGIKEEPPMKIKSKWTLPGGGYGYSYVTDTATESQVFNEEAIKAYIEKNVKISPINAPLANNSFMLSVYTTDKHIGAETARNSLYSNNYDREEIFDRHEKLVEKLLQQKEMFGSFEKCVFWDLGDALDGMNGQTTRGGHNLPQNMDSREQIDTFIEVTIKTIEQLIQGDIANELWFIATSMDNHAGSFAHGALRSVQLYLDAKYPHIVKTFVTAKMLDHITFGKHTFIFGHGKDDNDMKSGLPLNLDLKTELFINDYIDRKCIRTDHIHVIKGDLHQSSINYGKRFRYVNNMSMYGSSKWIHTNFGSGASGVDYEIVPLNGGEPYRTRIVYQHDS